MTPCRRGISGLNVNAVRGAQNRAAGKLFEQVIKTACERYRHEGRAEIEKTPEPIRQLGDMDRNGRFRACYEKRAQPDFKGTLKGGRSVVFEAKFTSAERMGQDVVLPQQAEALDRHMKLGAECFILVGFGLDDCYSVPWTVWRNMKEHFGRKYVTPKDLRERGFAVQYRGGVLRFLGREGTS